MNKKNKRNGYAIEAAMLVGGILILLAVSLFMFVSNQHSSLNIIVNGEAAHFIAEAAISRSVVSIRNALSDVFANNGQTKLYELLTQAKVPDTNITKLLNDTWNKDLKEFTKDIDPTASAEITVWLRDFKATETDKNNWYDPIAKKGFVVIEAVGKYKNGKRTLSIRRSLDVTNILPGAMGKFTLFVKDSGMENKYNILRNNYKGTITDGPKPLIVYNHAVPDSPEQINDNDEANPEIWKKRGWIWLGGKTKLNLCSGAGELGEIFHFYDVSRPNNFTPISFSTPSNNLPEKFVKGVMLPWDRSSSVLRTVKYILGHSFVLDGFHDKSSRQNKDAMYEGGILSSNEKSKYGSKSSVLHLYGDARPGYRSRTKIFGDVYANFIRFGTLEVDSSENDVADMLKNTKPKPIYLLRSMSKNEYKGNIYIKDINDRNVGGPMATLGMIFQNYDEYTKYMSAVIEQPYVLSYNSMQEVLEGNKTRSFPPKQTILKPTSLVGINLKGDGEKEFNGIPSGEAVLNLFEKRVNAEVNSIAEFWSSFLNSKNELELNCVVRIKNSAGTTFQIPPDNIRSSLKVKGGGAIILEKGSLELGGVVCETLKEVLTVAVKDSGTVRFTSINQNQVNVIAPNAELGYSTRINMFGTLCVRSLFVDDRFQGGKIIFRQGTDPLQCPKSSYYKMYLSPKDSYWNG